MVITNIIVNVLILGSDQNHHHPYQHHPQHLDALQCPPCPHDNHLCHAFLSDELVIRVETPQTIDDVLFHLVQFNSDDNN